jgi:hypothetical protein
VLLAVLHALCCPDSGGQATCPTGTLLQTLQVGHSNKHTQQPPGLHSCRLQTTCCSTCSRCYQLPASSKAHVASSWTPARLNHTQHNADNKHLSLQYCLYPPKLRPTLHLASYTPLVCPGIALATAGVLLYHHTVSSAADSPTPARPPSALPGSLRGVFSRFRPAAGPMQRQPGYRPVPTDIEMGAAGPRQMMAEEDD